ncbi:hypothetical protein, partial [Salmonella enterica]|uniref:hypothetical protein n=1 Tax=Salmonella enterica TaxID=28901 RepID=UPI00398C5F9A
PIERGFIPADDVRDKGKKSNNDCHNNAANGYASQTPDLKNFEPTVTRMGIKVHFHDLPMSGRLFTRVSGEWKKKRPPNSSL